MVDSPNYANSPLANPDFLNRIAPAPQTEVPGFSALAPGIIDRAVAAEPVYQAATLAEQKRELEAEAARLRSRSADEIIGDALLNGSAAAASGVVSIVGLALKGVGAGVEYLAPDDSLLNDIGALTNDAAMIVAAEQSNNISSFLKSGQSDVATEDARIQGEIANIDSQFNQEQYKQDIASGDSEFLAGLTLFGRDVMDFGDRVLSDPVATGDLLSNALGSIASGSILASTGKKIATETAERFGMEGVQKLALETGGSALGMGITEASSTYTQTVDEVMGRSPEEMQSSALYVELTGLGMPHEQALMQVADAAGLQAFRDQLPAAMAAGLLSAKFNANPLSVMRGENPLGAFITAGKEALEEAVQGGTGQLNQNRAIQDIVDPEQSLLDGVGSQAMGGLLGGFGASGAIGVGPAVMNGLQEQSDRIKDEVANERFVAGMGEQIAQQRRADARRNMTFEERDAELRSGMTAKAPGEDLFNSVVNKGAEIYDMLKETAQSLTGSDAVTGAVDTLKAGVQAVREAAGPVVSQVIKTAQDYTERGNPVIQSETVAAVDTVVAAANDPAVETGSLGTPDASIKKESLPEIFRDSVPEGSSLADTMANIVKTISSNKTPISEMKDDAILFVAQKYNEMQNAASTLSADVQSSIKKVLASPDLERIRKRAARLDLNTAVSSTVQKISSTVKLMTVSMSKINPTNVNPDVVDKILKQEDREDLTPEDIRSMEIAASVSRPLNAYKENIVKIVDEKYQALVATGDAPAKPETNVEKVSRNLIVGNLSGDNKVPSINETANRIIIGMQSPDQSVDIEGVRVPVAQVATNFRKLAQHMINKVNALNESFDKNDDRGVGPVVNHDTLVRGKDFIKAGMVGSKSVTYNKRSVNSVTFAKTVGADAQVLGEVYNALVQAFPEAFPEGPVQIPVLKTVENQNTTAVEEVTAAAGTDENAETTQEDELQTTAVEDISPEVAETIEPKKDFNINGMTQEQADAMNEEELLVSVNSWEPDVQSKPMIKTRADSIMEVMKPLMEPLGLPSDIIRLIAWLESPEKSHAGQAYWAERVMSLKPSVVRRILKGEEAGGIHVFFRELFHLIDAKASKTFGRTASMDQYDFDAADGLIYDEVKALSNSEFKDYFSYAFSFSTPEEVSSELFAEIGAMMMLMDREEARKLLPNGVAYVEKVIEQAGGVKVSDGNTTPVTDKTAFGDDQEGQVSDRFVSVFKPKRSEKPFKNVRDILKLIAAKPGNEIYSEFAEILLPRIADGMNARLEVVPFSTKDPRPVIEVLKEDQASVLEIRDFKPLGLINLETGKYDPRMLNLASMAVIDWMTTARSYGADRLTDLLDELDLKAEDLTDQQIKDLLNSVPPRSTTEGLAKKVVKLWNMQANTQAEMVDIRGTTEGLVKEIITVLSQMEDPLVRIISIKVSKGDATSFEISALGSEQEAIGMSAAGSLDKVLFPEDQIQASIGEKIVFVPKTQNNKPDVALSAMEQTAIKNMQDTPHSVAVPVAGFFKALGLDVWNRMAGKKDSSALAARHPLRLTIEGKNTSIERDYITAFQMVDAAGDQSVYYPVGVTDVGRHQMKGINPQNNKLLRAMITPTFSKLNMSNNQKHKDAFWLTVAQSSDLAKVEKKLHGKILASIQEDFSKTFGAATKLAVDYLTSGTLDSEGFADAMLKANKGEEVSAAQINAVLAVARLQTTKDLSNFETTLSFELDGKTDGPANMMVAFGQGIMTRLEYLNFKRIGFFLGSKNETLNTLFSNGEVDLYEVNSTIADKRMFDMIRAAKGADKQRLMALQRFAAHFGDFVINADGSITMSRATSKNPMTKKVYGSGEKGIAEGISQDMLVGFYTKLTALPDGVTVEEHLNYPEINSDLDFLFGTKLPEKLDVNMFTLPTAKMVPFAEYVKKTIGTILSESTQEVISEKTIGVNDLLVYITGVQGEFMSLYFEQRIAEIVEEGRKEWEVAGKPGKFALRKVTQAAYDAVVKETLAFAPQYNDGLQNLRVGSFSGQQDKTEMSSNLDGKIRAKSTMAKPDVLGVKVIPYVIQGRGDAMMMNRIFSGENAPQRAIPIFDGIDMAIADFGGLSDQINEAVLSNWDHDVLSPIMNNFDQFLSLVQEQGLDDKLQKAFLNVKEKSDEKSSVVAYDVQDLKTKLAEAVRLNQARKAVFKQITLSVDHMGGSGQAYVRNSDGKELTFEEINSMIQDQVDGIVSSSEPTAEIVQLTQEVETSTLVVTDVSTVVDALIRETKKPHIRDAIRAIRGMLPDDAQIIMGTPEQIAQWRKENLDQNPINRLDQTTKGYYDVGNNIIFIMSDNPETIVHEMIHMATFKAVLAHYTGETKSTAVKNLEVLMAEFMAMDFTTAPKKAQQAANAAKAQIIKAQVSVLPMDQAVALNEFMAWSLSNESLMKELKATPTSLVSRLTKVAKAWIQKILGVIPLDMYSNILFNTEMIQNSELPGGFADQEPPVPPVGTEELTFPVNNFTNFWIDRLRDSLEQSKTATGKEKQEQLLRYISTADDALVKLDFGGFALSDYQKKTFTAIHAVVAAELRLDSNALIALGKVYEHITNNLTPAMFGTGQAAQDRYSTVMELMGATKNDEGISDAVAVLMALSQTSNAFRTAMEQIPQPAGTSDIQTTSLNDLLTSTTGFLMQKLLVSTDTEGKGVKDILDGLTDQIIRQDDANEFKALKTIMSTFDKADAYVGGALSLLAQRTRDLNRGIQSSDANGLIKTVAGSITLATAFLDKDLSKQAGKGIKAATHMDGMLDGAVFIRELVAEVVGADAVNADTIQMLDKVTYVVQSTRQAYREELPVILQNEFTNHPTAEQWKDLHNVLGKGDFAALFDLKNPDDSFDMMSDQSLLDQRIKDKEKKILREFPGQIGSNILLKSKQLADYNNGKGAGFQLWKNAYAIHKLVGGKKPSMVQEIDKLISLYALNGTDMAQRESVARMQAEDPNGVHNLLVYVQALNKEEDQKTISEAARMNGYKGYIPDHGKGEVSLIIARDAEREDLEKRGYVRVSDDTTDAASLISRGYYMSTTKQAGNYSQGVLQQVQDTYRGVNATTGLTVNGTVSGVISGVAVVTITDALNQSLSVTDPKSVLIPVMDEDGGVLYYERSINPDLIQKYIQPESNMALMTGAWAGRQVEEKFSHEYNKALVTKLKSIWDNREPGTDGLFIQINNAKDKVYAESWKVIPPQLKEHIIEVFGEDTGFMVRKDMINLALGYRDPSITDVWTGNHRLPEAVTLAIKVAGKATMGDKAYKWLANTEALTMNTISSAKDLIVVRSLVVPLMNTQSNVFQLVNRGVGTKKIMKGYREKFVEIDKLNVNLKKIMGLQARVRLAATDKNKVAILKQQIQVLEDENNRFTVAPLVKEGAYKNISEGITELDVSITDGKFGDWFEGQLNRLPAGVQTVAKYGLLSKDTAIYKGANKAVQYGDFVAKSIYYDDLIGKGLTHDQAMVKVNEEFINFSLLPGRTRTYLESMGATWFLTFKIRSIKVALQMMRENPVRSLAMVNGLGIESGPLTDNVLGKLYEGTLPYSLGWDMLWDAPGMNPWIELTNG